MFQKDIPMCRAFSHILYSLILTAILVRYSYPHSRMKENEISEVSSSMKTRSIGGKDTPFLLSFVVKEKLILWPQVPPGKMIKYLLHWPAARIGWVTTMSKYILILFLSLFPLRSA